MSGAPITAEDLYLYAMQLLPEDEQNRLSEFLLQSPEARAELARVRSDLALYALSAEPQTPPTLTRQRLLKQVARERRSVPAERKNALAERRADGVDGRTAPQMGAATPASERPDASLRAGELPPMEADTFTPSSSRETALPLRGYAAEAETRRRSLLNVLLPWAGWAVAAGLAVAAYQFHRRAEGMQDQVTFARASAERAAATSARAEAVMEALRSNASQRFTLTRQSTQPIPTARVTYLAENGTMVFQGSNLDPLPPYKTYELWLIPAGEGRQPIPAGTFKPDGHGYASVVLTEMTKGVVAGTFGVTMEDDGGSQTPTLPILMIGA